MPDVRVVLRPGFDADFGDGPARDHLFCNANQLVDKQTGYLHIHNQTGTVASFPRDAVIGAVHVGTVVSNG